MATPTLADVVAAIVNGNLDGNEQTIYDAIKTRRTMLDAIKSATFKVGDRVKFSDAASPKYLCGTPATVTKIGGTGKRSVSVTINPDDVLDYRARKFTGGPIKCPVGIIEAA